MRVVSGTARGKRLLSVPGDTTRPILDRVKTALFDILRPNLPGTVVLDLFAGTGSVGIEALSQGAAHCTFLDLSAAAVRTIKQNLEITELSKQAEVRNTDAFTYLRNCKKSFDLIYVAPPQYKALWIEAMQTLAEHPERLTPTATVVVQIDPTEYEELNLSHLRETSQRKYGSTLLVFYGMGAGGSSE